MKSPPLKQSSVNSSSQNPLDKTPSDFWKAVRTNIKLQHHAPPIQPVPRNGNLFLSFAQERLWLLEQLQPESSIHNMRAGFRLKGSLNVDALEKSLGEIVRRHEILRTTFSTVEGQPIQVISPEIDLKLPIVDLRNIPETERYSEAQKLAIKEAEQPFNLAEGPLWRFKLLRLAEEEYWLLRTVHHIVFDGWSYRVFMRELAVLYEAFTANKSSPLPELPIQYADFAQSQRQWLQGEVLESQLAYWQNQLGGNLSELKLPIDRPRPLISRYPGASQSLVLPKNLTQGLKTLSHQEGVSLFVTLLATFKSLLFRYTEQEDILVCSPVASRNRVETKKLIGYFNNLVVIRTELKGNPSFRNLLKGVSRVTLKAHQHQDLPFQKLAELLDLANTPLSRAMFILQNTPSQPLELAGIRVTPLDLDWETTNFDLSLSMKEKGENLMGLIRYRTDLFNATTISDLLDHFQSVLESFVANPESHLVSLPSLTKREPERQFNQTLETNYVAPQKEIEQTLAAVWQEVLQLEKVGIHCNFFELGGRSFAIIKVYNKLREIFDRDISVVDLFRYPTINGMAQYLSQEGNKEQSTFQQIHNSATKQKEALKRKKQLMKFRRKTNG